MAIVEAAADLCRVVWVIGWAAAPLEFPMRGLQRLGEVIDIGSLDEPRALDALGRLSLSGIIAFTDGPQPLAARAARHLRLPYCTPEAARNLSDKLDQRRALEAADIAVPGFATIRPSAILAAGGLTAQGVRLPAVLKPQRGSGSRDTFLVTDDGQLCAALGGCHDEDFILEEYIADRPRPASGVGADMVSVETVVERGHIHHLAVTGRFRLAAPFRETGSFLPSDLEEEDLNAVRALATAAIQAVGVDHGVLHTEIKMSPAGPRIIEINGRVGGGIPGLLEKVGGPPLLVWAMRLALSLEIGPFAGLPVAPVAFFRWLTAPVAATEVLGIDGVAEASALRGVETVRVNRRPGAPVDFREGGTFGHVVAVTGRVADHRELGQLLAQIDATLLLSYAPP